MKENQVEPIRQRSFSKPTSQQDKLGLNILGHFIKKEAGSLKTHIEICVYKDACSRFLNYSFAVYRYNANKAVG